MERTSWIYFLRKEDLVTYLSEFELEVGGTVEELSKRLATFAHELGQDHPAYTRVAELEAKHPRVVDTTSRPQSSTNLAIPEGAPEGPLTENKTAFELPVMPWEVNLNKSQEVRTTSLRAPDSAHWPNFQSRPGDNNQEQYSNIPSTSIRLPERTARTDMGAVIDKMRKWQVCFGGVTRPVGFCATYQHTHDQVLWPQSRKRKRHQQPKKPQQSIKYLDFDEKHMFLELVLGKHLIHAIIDTGATRSFISPDLAARIRDIACPQTHSLIVCMADGTEKEITERLDIPLQVESRTFTQPMLVLPQVTDHLILGMDFLMQIGATLQCGNLSIKLRRLTKEHLENQTPYTMVPYQELNTTEIVVNNTRKEAFKKHKKFKKKKTGKWRLCINYRHINAKSEKDGYPVPRMLSILDRIRGAQYVSTLDLKNGYWRVHVHPNSRPCTAFTITGKGLLQWKVLPFRLHSAPAIFQRLLDRAIGTECEPFAFAYLYDIVVIGNTLEEHMTNMEVVLNRLRAANLRINKCQFLKTELRYLGQMISREGIQPPTNVKKTRRILGIASWYRCNQPITRLNPPPLDKEDTQIQPEEETELAPGLFVKNRAREVWRIRPETTLRMQSLSREAREKHGRKRFRVEMSGETIIMHVGKQNTRAIRLQKGPQE